MVKVVVKNKIDCEDLLGQFVDESNYDILVEEDTDCYMSFDCAESDLSSTDAAAKESILAFKFRKNFFTRKEQDDAYIGLRDAATKSQNRGLAAGPKGDPSGGRDWVSDLQIELLEHFAKAGSSVDKFDVAKEVELVKNRLLKDKVAINESARGMAWLKDRVKEDKFDFDKWIKKISKNVDNHTIAKDAKRILAHYISKTTYANTVDSGIAGWYDRYTRTPYGRATAYTEHHFDKFKMAYPFLQSLNRGFKELAPWRWSNQKEAADKIDQRYLVPDTVFTTITVNKTFRTACHRDAGDFSKGLSNLLVLSNNGKYTGGYLVFPEYRVAVNVRPGDLLIVNNHEIIHGNTPIVCEEGAERISIVCYLREGMLELKSKEYEDARYNFIEERRNNREHPNWHAHWNGISPDMFKSAEWKQYLISHGMEDEDGIINMRDINIEDMFS